MINVGDRVLVRDNVIEDLVPGNCIFSLVATKGSNGKVVSHEDYCAFVQASTSSGLVRPEIVKVGMESGTLFPILLELVVPMPDHASLPEFISLVECEVGKMVVVDSRYLQIINE